MIAAQVLSITLLTISLSAIQLSMIAHEIRVELKMLKKFWLQDHCVKVRTLK